MTMTSTSFIVIDDEILQLLIRAKPSTPIFSLHEEIGFPVYVCKQVGFSGVFILLKVCREITVAWAPGSHKYEIM